MPEFVCNLKWFVLSKLHTLDSLTLMLKQGFFLSPSVDLARYPPRQPIVHLRTNTHHDYTILTTIRVISGDKPHTDDNFEHVVLISSVEVLKFFRNLGRSGIAASVCIDTLLHCPVLVHIQIYLSYYY